MKSVLAALLGIILLNGCTQHPATTQQPELQQPLTVIDDNAIANSACAKYLWKGRGKAPRGYILGMAKTYSRSFCRKNPVMLQASASPEADALAYYGIKAVESDRLRKLYTLMIGLGMRESSGNYGTGRDKSATNLTAETAESGLFQFSYNLRTASPELTKLYNEYKASPSLCMEPVFAVGARPVEEGYSGTGEGLEFQKLARHCPAFSTEYAAIGLRVRRKHWGPINRKEAEYREECEHLLANIEATTVCK